MGKIHEVTLTINFEALKRVFAAYSQGEEVLAKNYSEHELFRLNDPNIHESILPLLMITAFTIELGIKSLYFRDQGAKWPRGLSHDIEKAFNLLDSSIQDRIIKDTSEFNRISTGKGLSIAEFHILLNRNARSFEVWRYFFESGKASGNQGFLQRLKKAVDQELQR